MTFFVVVLAVIVWFAWRTHRRTRAAGLSSAFSNTRGNSLAWKAAHRKRFRLGPASWRLDNGEDGTL